MHFIIYSSSVNLEVFRPLMCFHAETTAVLIIVAATASKIPFPITTAIATSKVKGASGIKTKMPKTKTVFVSEPKNEAIAQDTILGNFSIFERLAKTAQTTIAIKMRGKTLTNGFTKNGSNAPAGDVAAITKL